MTFVVNRNINVSNVCIVGCAFCGFGQGKRSPDAYEHDRDEFVRRVHEAVEFGATEICMQSGIHPDWTLEDYEGWLRARQARPRRSCTCTPTRAMEVAHMCDTSGLSPDEVFARLRAAGLDSTPGTAAEVLHDGVRERISPNKLPVARWVQIIEASHRAGLRSTVTVMFGHIEEPWELAEHMRVVRELQERTGGFTEFVPLSFIPFHTLLGRTHGVQEISREENLKHTAVFRLALGRSVANLQASWVKMGLDAATEALRWGVNDLGGTLMEENISRLAGSYHGVMLEPADLVAAAHRAGRPAAERTTLYEMRRALPAGPRRPAHTPFARCEPARSGQLASPDGRVREDHRGGARRVACGDRAARDGGPRADGRAHQGRARARRSQGERRVPHRQGGPGAPGDEDPAPQRAPARRARRRGARERRRRRLRLDASASSTRRPAATMDLTIVGPTEADLKNGRLSFESPVAQALVGARVGDTVTVATPGGDRRYRVERVG